MIEHSNCQLDILWLTSDNDQSLSLIRRTSRLTTNTDTHRTGFHDFDLTTARLTDLIDLRATFTNDAPDKIVGDENLLRLKRSCRGGGRHHMIRVGGGEVCGSGTAAASAFVERARWTGLTIGKANGAMRLLLLDKDVANVVRGNMNGISDTRHT
jgi:hypothetical protein